MMITAALPFKASKDEAFVIEHRPKRSFGRRGASESFSFGPFPSHTSPRTSWTIRSASLHGLRREQFRNLIL